MTITYGSVCSGIESATVAWDSLGWKPQWFSEVEKFPSEVLKYHYPNVPNLGDMTKIRDNKTYGREKTIDLLVGGTPCQAFSLAGLRGGMDDERANLSLEFCRLAQQTKPRWIVWENVLGVLSSGKGRDFHSIVEALTEIGYGVAWRILDAQYFGVAQRRKRLFLVGYLGDWRPSQAVLLEPKSFTGTIAPSREKAQERLERNTKNIENSFGENSRRQITSHDIASTLCARDYKDTNADDLATGFKGAIVYENHPNASRINEVDVCPTMTSRWGTGGGNVPFVQDISIKLSNTESQGRNINETGVGYTLDASGSCNQATMQNAKVRKLTPKECERLQGFPDNYTQIPWRNKEAKDCPVSHRYKALGNSMAVPVMKWIGERIQTVETLIKKLK
tara:strand:+ start:2939 stop:4114 length:1176 start_codon:yes stop_codon:yes gene_type:complete